MTVNWYKTLFAASAAALALTALPLMAQDDMRPTRTVATYESWSIACSMVQITPAQGEPRMEELCELVSQVNIRGEDSVIRPLLQVVVGRLPGQEAMRLLVQVPGNAYLREPVSLILDPGEDHDPSQVPETALRASYIRCDTGRCVADVTLSEADQTRLSKAQSAIVSYINLTGSRVGVPLSMTGYAAAAGDMSQR